MTTKLERYINYIVGELISNTEIDYVRKKIKYPFYPYRLFHSPTLMFSDTNNIVYTAFEKAMMEMYGARPEETQIIFSLYKKKLIDLYRI